MTPSQILSLLLADHSSLREMVRETRRVADLARQGAPVTDDLLESLSAMAASLRAHSAREEELLHGLLRSVDAWGPARAEIMDEEHVEQHSALHGAIVRIPNTPGEFAGAGVAELLDQLLEHMEREERAFLNPQVLRDDEPLPDSMSG
jgi:hypothetical protein